MSSDINKHIIIFLILSFLNKNKSLRFQITKNAEQKFKRYKILKQQVTILPEGEQTRCPSDRQNSSRRHWTTRRARKHHRTGDRADPQNSPQAKPMYWFRHHQPVACVYKSAGLHSSQSSFQDEQLDHLLIPEI